MSRRADDELAARLRSADPVAGWAPDEDAALSRFAEAAPDLVAALRAADRLTASDATAVDGTVEVRLGDLAVVHQPQAAPRRSRTTAYAVIFGAAAAVALVIGLVPGLLPSGGDTNDRLAVTPLPPAASAPPTSGPPAPATSTQPHARRSAPAVIPVAPPPTGLAVTMSLSATTVHAGNGITVSYSWTDGSGQLLYLNAIGITAVKVVRPPACAGTVPVAKPGSGHGSWIFSVPLGQPALIEGVPMPFDHPMRVKVGVQIGTGGRCGPVEEKTVTQWVTVYPAVSATSSPTP